MFSFSMQFSKLHLGSLSQLPLHNKANETTTKVTEVYHGLFMAHYSSK